MERALEGKVAVITGNARGIGRGISLVLAETGVNIVGNHVSSDSESMATAEKTRQEIESFGVKSTSIVADIATLTGRRALLEAALVDSPEGIDYLILNAAGGLGKSVAEAKRINVDAQWELVNSVLPHMKPGGAIMLITSLWGEKHGEAQQMPGYESVASTKKMIENALVARIPEFDGKGIRFLIVCGHVVPGTQAFGYFMATNPQLITELKKTAEGGEFPTTLDMGRGTRDLILSNQSSGSVIYVGGNYVEPLIKERHTVLDQEGVARKLSMYGKSKLRINEYQSGTDLESGISTYTLKPGDCHGLEGLSFDKVEQCEDPRKGVYRRIIKQEETEGHFVIDGEEEPVYRGVDLIKYAARSVILQWRSLHPDTILEPTFIGGESYSFEAMVFPGNRVTFYPEITSEDDKNVMGDCEIRVGDAVVARMKGIKGVVDEKKTDDGNHEKVEIAAQAIVLTSMDKNPTTKGVPIFLGGGEYTFYEKVSIGDKLTCNAIVTAEEVDSVTGNCEVRVGDTLIAKITGIKGGFLPGMDLAREVIFDQRAERRSASKRALAARSEERRVGKECRSRWSPYH